MERSIQDGHSVLIENMGEQIEPVRRTLWADAFQERTYNVLSWDKEVPFNNDFQLFLPSSNRITARGAGRGDGDQLLRDGKWIRGPVAGARCVQRAP